MYECGFSSDASAKRDLLEEWGIQKYELSEEQKELYDAAHEPLSYAIQNTKNKIKDILDITKVEVYETYLTGKGNFRYEIMPEYKANRDPSHRPFWYKELRKYLIEDQDAIVVDDMEADDILGIRQMDQRVETIICSKDKDLDCIPGLHYNWSPTRWENGVYDVTEEEANRFFYTQCLTGDSTDNIPGLKKLTGQIATKKRKDALMAFHNGYDMFTYIAGLYGDVDFHPTAKCLWIMRSHNDIWEAPINEE